jgi:hypothetical protein
MAGRVDGICGMALRLGAAMLGALCAACAGVSDPAGFSVVTQDKYDYSPCVEIVTAHRAQTTRVKDLTALVEKAESAPGGVIVSYAAYRSELASARAMLAAANRGARKNNCDLTKQPPPGSTPAPAQAPPPPPPLMPTR